jgi:hypothetical protein
MSLEILIGFISSLHSAFIEAPCSIRDRPPPLKKRLYQAVALPPLELLVGREIRVGVVETDDKTKVKQGRGHVVEEPSSDRQTLRKVIFKS